MTVYLHNGFSYTGKRTYLYWIRALITLMEMWLDSHPSFTSWFDLKLSILPTYLPPILSNFSAIQVHIKAPAIDRPLDNLSATYRPTSNPHDGCWVSLKMSAMKLEFWGITDEGMPQGYCLNLLLLHGTLISQGMTDTCQNIKHWLAKPLLFGVYCEYSFFFRKLTMC